MTGALGQRTATAGFDTQWTKIPRERLHPNDLHRMIDWVRDGWADDEFQVTPRLQRLRWHLYFLPEPFQSEALEQYAILTRARLVAGQPWVAAVAKLQRLVSAWGQAKYVKRPSI